ncbi:MAG: AAA family ATPase [Thiobacillus sp.]|nr:AAA family ATPase [Thiobacillus sp.]
MLITRLTLKNWRNFHKVDVALRERVYVIGPNASGKSNLLDVLRFLRDVAKPEGGGLQKAVKDRGGVTKLRCLLARKDPEISIEIELAERVDTDPVWRYTLAFKSEGKGQQRPLVSQEKVEDLRSGKVLLNRPDNKEDKVDPERLTQTHLEQINTNREFREVADFFASVTYLHLVPQLLKHAEELGGYRMEDDPFGQAFLERIAKTPEKTSHARLSKIEEVLRVCVPNMRNLRFVRDKITGTPHLEALYEHWRPDAGWQREDQFSDGTLRLLGIMWSLLEGNSLLLLEEPELSLNEDIVRQIHQLIWRMQRQAKYRRQVFITTHSEALLQEKSIDPREVIRLEPTRDGTNAIESSDEDKALIAAGYSVAETMLPKVKPAQVDQLSQFRP